MKDIFLAIHETWLPDIVAPLLILVLSVTLVYFYRHWAPRRRGQVPPYWAHTDREVAANAERWSEEYFDDTFPVAPEHRDLIQEVMRDCCRGDAERTFRIVRVVRHENCRLWHEYSKEASSIGKVRGKCEFAAGAEPVTLDSLREIDEDDKFSQFNPDVGEAYLWYGTEPEAALRLLHDGFGAEEGKACLERLDFFEDTSRADKDASAGTGLYKDCYSMLLCRVLLGSQQVVGSACSCTFDQGPVDLESSCATSDTDATVEGDLKTKSGRRCFDSTVVQDADGPKVFTVCRHTQVYPEYAVVYERCVPQDLRASENSRLWTLSPCSAGRRSERAPVYWRNAHNQDPYAEMHPVVNFKPRIQAMMTGTWQAKYTRDRRTIAGQPVPRGDPNGDIPGGARVLKAMRVENSGMWANYAKARDRIRSRRGDCSSMTRHEAYTLLNLEDREQRRLAGDVNEVYLWHGSSPQAVISIADQGFDLDLSGSNVGAMFGRGVYLAECASKADEYAKDDPEGHYQGLFAMLLCRVVLGEMQTLTSADHEAHSRTGLERKFDSTVGDREDAVGTFREFVVPSRDQVYPEYAIIYERVYRNGRLR